MTFGLFTCLRIRVTPVQRGRWKERRVPRSMCAGCCRLLLCRLVWPADRTQQFVDLEIRRAEPLVVLTKREQREQFYTSGRLERQCSRIEKIRRQFLFGLE